MFILAKKNLEKKVMLLHFESRFFFSSCLLYLEIQDEGFLAARSSNIAIEFYSCPFRIKFSTRKIGGFFDSQFFLKMCNCNSSSCFKCFNAYLLARDASLEMIVQRAQGNVNLAEFPVANDCWLHAVAERSVGSMRNGRILRQMRLSNGSEVILLILLIILVDRSATATESLVSSSRAHDQGVQLVESVVVTGYDDAGAVARQIRSEEPWLVQDSWRRSEDAERRRHEWTRRVDGNRCNKVSC
jgi:hypothetical protein